MSDVNFLREILKGWSFGNIMHIEIVLLFLLRTVLNDNNNNSDLEITWVLSAHQFGVHQPVPTLVELLATAYESILQG